MKKLLLFTTLAAVLLSACAAPTATPTPEKMMDKPTEMMPHTETPMLEDIMQTATPEAMMDHEETATPAASVETPAWFAATLTDVRTGKTFSINDFKGKVVLVETMAQWCSNCLKQQNQVKVLHEMIEDEDFISIGLDIDLNESPADLKSYVENKGFDWLYAVPTADVAREIGNLYTAQFLNPPSTPILIVDRNGVAHPLPFGIKGASDLAASVNMYLAE